MRDLIVPPNWAQIVQNSSELVITEQYDLTKTWFKGQYYPTADTILQTPDDDALSNLQVTIYRSQAEMFQARVKQSTQPTLLQTKYSTLLQTRK